MDWQTVLQGDSPNGLDEDAWRRNLLRGAGEPPIPVVSYPQPVEPPTIPPPAPVPPEIIAKNAAARGIPPPPSNPAALPSWASAVGANLGPGAVGSALTGKPQVAAGPRAPMDIRPPAQQQETSTDVSAQAKPGMGKFADTLKGLKAPENPQTQRVSTPNAPRPTTQIKAGEILALLQALQSGGGAGAAQFPSTLGAAIRK